MHVGGEPHHPPPGFHSLLFALDITSPQWVSQANTRLSHTLSPNANSPVPDPNRGDISLISRIASWSRQALDPPHLHRLAPQLPGAISRHRSTAVNTAPPLVPSIARRFLSRAHEKSKASVAGVDGMGWGWEFDRLTGLHSICGRAPSDPVLTGIGWWVGLTCAVPGWISMACGK